jgi:hypothetical protein
LNPISVPTFVARLPAAWLGPRSEGGCHAREINAVATSPVIRDQDTLRVPSERRARKVLSTAYIVREPKPERYDWK